MKRRGFIGGILALVSTPFLPKIAKAESAEKTYWAGTRVPRSDPDPRLGHLQAVYYSRVAFDKHALGIPKPDAEEISRGVCRKIWGGDWIFPAIEWGRFDEYQRLHSKART